MTTTTPSTGIHHAPQRSGTADIMRTLGMLLVVAGHSEWLARGAPEVHRLVYLFHMPMFFFVSGCVFKPKAFAPLAANRAERLLVPFAFIGALSILYYLLTDRPFPVDNPWLGLLWATGNTIPWTPMWFLPTLFLTTLAQGLVNGRAKGMAREPAFIALSVAALAMCQYLVLQLQSGHAWFDHHGRPVGWPWGLDLLPICLAYFSLGTAFGSKAGGAATAWMRSGRIRLLGLFASLAVLLLVHQSGASLDLNQRRFEPYLAVLAGSVGGILAVLFASDTLASSARLSAWAQAFSEKIMVIFLFHSPIQAALLRALPPERFSSAAVAYLAAILLPILLHSLFVKRSAVANFLLGGGRSPPTRPHPLDSLTWQKR